MPALSQLVSRHTRRALRMDYWRLRARLRGALRRPPQSPPRLHFGCGRRRVPGWLNVDLVGSDYDVDLGAGRLPWPDQSFEAIVSQHVIEHFEYQHELKPLLADLFRMSRPGAELWLSCPDMEKVCRGYVDDQGRALRDGRYRRFPDQAAGEQMPPQQFINELFHQSGEHKNLFDYELLRYALEQAGFGQIERIDEADFLARFPEFPRRDDDDQSLYVTARKPG